MNKLICIEYEMCVNIFFNMLFANLTNRYNFILHFYHDRTAFLTSQKRKLAALNYISS